jgi:hypothetical protein
MGAMQGLIATLPRTAARQQPVLRAAFSTARLLLLLLSYSCCCWRCCRTGHPQQHSARSNWHSCCLRQQLPLALHHTALLLDLHCCCCFHICSCRLEAAAASAAAECSVAVASCNSHIQLQSLLCCFALPIVRSCTQAAAARPHQTASTWLPTALSINCAVSFTCSCVRHTAAACCVHAL